MISINNISVEFASKPLFSDLNVVINKNDKIALVGKNGAGKSTLLKIIAGFLLPSSGSISRPLDITIGYLPQQMEVSDDTILIDEVKKTFSHLSELKQTLDKLNAELCEREDYDSPDYISLIEKIETLNDHLAIEGIYNMDAEIERTLIGLGFKRSDFNRPTSEFSGGWRMRVELAKILLRNPDILLLDEPTNHLDIESIQWLEKFMKTKAKAVVLVSHDRAFLDNVTSRTVEISCGRAYDYKVNYSQFINLRKERVAQQVRAYENQQKQIADIKEFIERFRYQATKAIQVQSRIKQLEKIIPIEVDEVDNSRLRLKFPPAERSGDYPIITEGLTKNYGDLRVFEGIDFTLKRGEKVALVGRNGEGKSTFVKCVMHQIPFDGTLKIGHNVKIGYFAQNQAQLLDGELTVFETIDCVAVGDIRTKIRDILGAFMFGGEDVDKKVKILSGGEKTRLAMVKLLLEPVNLLILDEPTNHLDIRTKDILKNAIKEFDGTVIIVSHDRYFLDGLVDKVYEFRDGRVRENIGGIYEFLETKEVDNQNMKTSQPPLQQKNEPAHSNLSGRLAYSEQKELSRKKNKLEKKIKSREQEIEKFEEEIKRLEAKLSKGEATADVLGKYEEAKRLLDDSMTKWEMAQMELESL